MLLSATRNNRSCVLLTLSAPCATRKYQGLNAGKFFSNFNI